MNKTEVALRKGNLVIAPADGPDIHGKIISVINAELMQFGYILSEDAYNALCKSDIDFITVWFNEVVNFLKKWLDKSDYKPFYNNVPKTVFKKSVREMLYDMVKTYWTTGNLEFDEKIQKEFHFSTLNENF